LEETGQEARKALESRLKDSWKVWGSGPNRLSTISFESARFDGAASFSGRTFERAANFTNARFYHPPDFDPAAKDARIDFTDAEIGFVPPGRLLHWTSDSKVPARLRALRKVAEETKNHDLERDLYIEERKAERGVYLRHLLRLAELKKNLEDINKQKKHVWLEWRLQRRARNAHWLGILATPKKIAQLILHLLWIGVMGLYWALADYGRNFLVPAIWLGLSVPFFDWRYTGVLARLMAKAPDVDKYKQAVDAGAWQRGAFRWPPHHRRRDQKISVLPRLWHMPAHSPGRLSGAGDRAEPRFDHPRVFHRPRVAQLFQDQVNTASGKRHQSSAWKIASRSRAPCSTRTISIPSGSYSVPAPSAKSF
jgi:hypothetical protein